MRRTQRFTTAAGAVALAIPFLWSLTHLLPFWEGSAVALAFVAVEAFHRIASDTSSDRSQIAAVAMFGAVVALFTAGNPPWRDRFDYAESFAGRLELLLRMTPMDSACSG